METPRKKAAGYVRVSTPGQASEGESLHTQRKQIQAYCKFKARLRALLSPARWRREIQAVEKEEKKIGRQVLKKERARKNLLSILEGRSLDPEEQERFVDDLGVVDEEIRRLKKSLYFLGERKYSINKRAQDSKSWIDFASDRKLELDRMADRLVMLEPPMKHKLINSMCDSPIRIAGDRARDKEAWVLSNVPSRINMDVLQEVLSESPGGSSDNTGGGGPNAKNPSWAFNNSTKDRRRLLTETYSIVFQRPC